MLPLLLTAAVLSASPVKLAAPNLTGPGMSKEELTFFTDHLAQQLGFQGLRVITSSEIERLLGFERQRQLLGCTDNSASCQAELANALGVDGLVTGSIGKLGKTTQINLKIIKAEDGTPLAAYSARAADSEAVLDRLTEAAEIMAKKVLERLGKAPALATKPPEETPPPKKEEPKPVDVPKDVPKKEEPVKVTAVDPNVGNTNTTNAEPPVGEVRTSGGLRSYAWMPAAGGAAVGVVGGILLVRASGYVGQITNARNPDEALDKHAAGKKLATTGYTLLGVGAAALLAGGGMFLFGGTSSVAVVPGPEPAAVVSGTFDFGAH